MEPEALLSETMMAKFMHRVAFTVALPAAALASLIFSGCGESGDSPTGSIGNKGTGGDFVVLRTEPANNGQLYLNEPVSVDFSNPVDLDSADLNTMSFSVFNSNGKALAEQPMGTFQVATSPGDQEGTHHRLQFVPRFPTNDTYDDGGFRPGRLYVVQLVGGDQRRGNVLRDTRGKGLLRPTSFQFRTAEGTTPSQLFRDMRPGGPRRVDFSVSPADTGGSSLNMGGQQPVQIVLKFDQALNPHSQNLPLQVDQDPTKRDKAKRGRLFLEYDDPDASKGKNTWIPARAELRANSLAGSEVVLSPVGVLPNNAWVRVIVENTLEDMSGESNVADASYNRIFAEFRVRSAYEPQFAALVESFSSAQQVDVDAPFLEPSAEMGPGYVRANFDFEGSATILNYEPTTREVILNTDFTQIVPKGAPPINIAGGVFSFNNVKIPAGVSVIGRGTRPMVWLATGDFVVEGTLSVNGGSGDRVDTLNSANFPTGGGVGACGSGNGGKGSPIATAQSPRGEAGSGSGQVPGAGGGGGRLSGNTSCNRGSAGGGGSYATQGDPYFKAKAGANNSFVQQKGTGGFGCGGASGSSTRSLPGGNPGGVAFSDARLDNNFWGSGVDVFRQIRITGELTQKRAGAGGGGGGDRSQMINNPNWITDAKGGGGGAGGGTLIIKALGDIIVGKSGHIEANGGHGGGGEQAGGNNLGGGGGAGSGGMVILMAGRSIQLYTHGNTYANNDWDFSVSADGGVGTQGRFGGMNWNKKYPPPALGAQWDNNPSGGMGGLGLVQLMAPPGDNSADNTNTVLDDNIHIMQGTQRLTGAEKKRFLAWRGFANDKGEYVDDFGNKTNIGDNEGDIRPAPILLPAPFGHRSRVRSQWIDTGATARRPLNAPDGNPRGIVEDKQNGFLAGPTYTFSGTQTGQSANWKGYINYKQISGGIGLDFQPQLSSPVQVSRIDPEARYDGSDAYMIELVASKLGATAHRYAQYRALLIDKSGSTLGEYRILAHGARQLFVARDSMLPKTAAPDLRLQVIAKFFEVYTDGAPGLGRTYEDPNNSQREIPMANVQIGFAFHKDAPNAVSKGTDPNRFPQRVGSFTYDLSSPAAIEAIRKMKAPYIKWDILFNTRFSEGKGNTNPAQGLSPSNPRPELRFLVLPERF